MCAWMWLGSGAECCSSKYRCMSAQLAQLQSQTTTSFFSPLSHAQKGRFISPLPANRLRAARFPVKTSHSERRHEPYLVLHVSPASVIVVIIYSGVCGASPRPLCSSLCVNPAPEAEGRRLPSPSRRLLAGDQNRKPSGPIRALRIQALL